MHIIEKSINVRLFVTISDDSLFVVIDSHSINVVPFWNSISLNTLLKCAVHKLVVTTISDETRGASRFLMFFDGCGSASAALHSLSSKFVYSSLDNPKGTQSISETTRLMRRVINQSIRA